MRKIIPRRWHELNIPDQKCFLASLILRILLDSVGEDERTYLNLSWIGNDDILLDGGEFFEDFIFQESIELIISFDKREDILKAEKLGFDPVHLGLSSSTGTVRSNWKIVFPSVSETCPLISRIVWNF